MVRISSPIHRRDSSADVDTTERVVVDEPAPERPSTRRWPGERRARPTAPVAPAATETAEPAVAAPGRARASGLATFGLLVGAIAAAAVATGVLAFPGVIVGLFGMLVAVAGVSATRRPHVAGRMDALLGLLLSAAAVVIGLLALSDQIPWLDTETDQVSRLSDWLVTQLPWLDRF